MNAQDVLEGLNATGGYTLSLVCTDEGLLIASAGEGIDSDEVAGLTSLFDDIVRRAERDLDIQRVDEVTLLDPGRGRMIIRPLPLGAELRTFLVVQAPAKATWRRNTNQACRTLAALLAPMLETA